MKQSGTIYLDHNATSPVKPAVAAAVMQVLEAGGNPSSVHSAGRAARIAVENAREQVASLVGAAARDVVFTSGGTEANNLCLRAFHSAGYKLFISGIEHPSVMTTALELGATVISVDDQGVIRLPELVERLAEVAGSDVLVSVMTANNETGVIQPLRAVADIAHEHGALLHTDAVQAAGKLSLDMNELDVDLVAISAHKIGGPSGSGALIVSPGVGKMKGIQTGGGQEKGLRPGTENLSGIAGFGAAAALAAEDLEQYSRLARLRDDMERRISEVAPKTRVFGADVERLVNTSCLAMPGVASEVQVMSLDLEGIAVSAGSACSSGKVAASPVLVAMGVEDAAAAGAIRVSLGWTTSEEDIDQFVAAWTSIYERLGNKSDELSAA